MEFNRLEGWRVGGSDGGASRAPRRSLPALAETVLGRSAEDAVASSDAEAGEPEQRSLFVDRGRTLDRFDRGEIVASRSRQDFSRPLVAR